jgi:putative heme-binding domain-containing protein
MIRRCCTLLLAASLAVAAAPAQDAPAPVKLEKGARIVLMGAGLASRMLHFGHFDTELHLRHPGHQLFIRNIADEGHTPSFRPHSARKNQLGFPGAEKFHAPYDDGRTADAEGFAETDEQWLNRLKPSVLVAFFGFTESFLGLGHLEAFRAELDAFLKHTLAQKYDGSAPPRLALVSPTAIQDRSAVLDVPDGKAQNAVLAAFSSAMEAVAARNGVLFVDAFRASQAWYREAKEPLTTDGVLLNDAGYARLAVLLADRIFAPGAAPDASRRAAVRAAVLDKDWLWLNDFKIPNGVHVYGRRHNPFGPANYPFEIAKIREMTDLRDRAIWAALEGKTLDLAALDAKTSPLPPVQTNYKPGGKNGSVNFLEGKDALAPLLVPEGYRIEQFATEKEFPFLANPVQMSFDNKGRLWVSVMPSYPHWRPGDPRPDDKLLILEDTDGDGRADKQTVFADRLHLPIGFEFAPEGVYVSQGTTLVLLKDTNGDDKADEKEIIASGFDDHDTHHAISAFAADESGAFIMAEGVFLRTSVETPYGTVRGSDGGFFRFDPRRRQLERHAQLSIPNPWGVAFDEWGQHFFLHTSGPDMEWMLPGSVKPRYGAANPRSPNLIEAAHRVRPTSGIEFVSSRHFPPEVQGDFLVNNNIGFLGTKQHQMREDGTGYSTRWRHDLLVSKDGNFRPVDLEFAPDGSLYVIDWHNPLIGHMQHNARDPHRDHAHGRIYRITYPSRPLVKPPPVFGAPIAQLLENLKLPEYRARYRSRRELRGRKPDEVLAAVAKWTEELDKADPNYEHQLLEGLWVTWGLNRTDEKLLRRLLEAKDHRARAAAVRVLRYSGHRIADQADLLVKAAQDPHGRVKLEAVVAASWIPKDAGLAVLDAAEKALAVSAPGPVKAEPASVVVSDKGRKIRVKHPEIAKGKVNAFTMALTGGTRVINLSEIEVMSGGQNVASQAKLSQSSEYNGGQFPVKNLVDGNKDNFSHTDTQKDPWVKAEFAKPVPIDELVIWNRQDFEDRFEGAVLTFFEGHHSLATIEVKIAGKGAAAGGGMDPWIRDAFRTAKAHLNNTTIESAPAVKVPGHLKGALRTRYLKGAELYAREGHCVTCHQPDGAGLELSGFPPLAKSPWVTEDEERLIKLTLNGMMGPLELNGKTYPGLVPMTPFGGLLNDEEIADVLTYVRNAFGNQAEPVSPAKVKQVREATKSKVGFYSPQELLDPKAAAAAGPSRAFVKMWAMDDFKGAFDAPLKGRNFERGKAAFEAAGCIRCHNVQGQGSNVGADLSKAADEYPGGELLRQILDPSARIKDEFRVVGVVLKNENRTKGMIVKREGDVIHLAENLQEPDKTIAIPKADIVKMIPSDLSPMPPGLLVTFTKEEVLDLLAFIASKGDAKHKAFSD